MHRAALSLALAASLAHVAEGQCPVVELGRQAPPRFRKGDYFGWSLALDGEQALVAFSHTAAPPASGSMLFLERRGDRWLRTDVLGPRAPMDDQSFGHAAALSGDWAAVSSSTSRGGVFVSYFTQVHLFQRSTGRWSEQLAISRNVPEELERFGNSISLSGSVLAIGDYGDDVLGSDMGAVYVYRFDGSSWTKEAELRSPEPAPHPHMGFGGAVATDGERILVGEFARAHVFRHDGGSWSLEGTLVGHDVVPRNGDGYGNAVALDGANAIVGAHWHQHGNRDEGAVFVFRRTESGWHEEAELLPDRSSIGVAFGRQVALAADRALISADGDDVADPGAGAAYLYRRGDAGWRLEQRLFPIGSSQVIAFASKLALGERHALLTTHSSYPSGSLHAFDLCVPARASFRNAAPNPAALRCDPPVLGQPWRAMVDSESTGHTAALVFGLELPDSRVAGSLGILLARAGSRGELLHAVPVAGPLATWEVAIPADARLLGFRCVVQAVLIGKPPSALTNAQDLVLGAY